MKLTANNQPVVCSNMTLEETLKAAESAFPTPSPIIALMFAYLRVGSDGQFDMLKKVRSGAETLHCPCCGTHLNIQDDANGGEKEEHF